MHILYGLLVIAGGTLSVIYSAVLVRMFGSLELAERYLGRGQTGSAWKLLGIVAIFTGIYLLAHA